MIDGDANIVEQADATSSAIGTVQMNLALHHLFAAYRFCARIREIEAAHAGTPFGPFWDEILHNALGVVTLTAACIECYANQLYFDGTVVPTPLAPGAITVVADMIDKAPPLQKYSAALVFRKGQALDLSVPTVQHVHALLLLRNAVIHFRPVVIDPNLTPDKVSKALDKKFAPSPYFPTEGLYPRAWASHGFAVWAINTTVNFLDHFCVQAGIESPLLPQQEYLSALATKAL